MKTAKQWDAEVETILAEVRARQASNAWQYGKAIRSATRWLLVSFAAMALQVAIIIIAR